MAGSVLAKLAVQISANTAEFGRAMEKSQAQLHRFAQESQKTQSVLGKFDNALKGLGVLGAIGILGNIGKSIFDIGVKAEQTRVQFETFLGSTQKAATLLKELNKFSLETPFSPDQINAAAKALLSFGIAQKDILPTIKILGDVSSGTGKDLAELAIIFGQIRSTGRLMGQDLLQLINAGFNPLQVISEQTGKSMGQLKKEMEKGLISFDMVESAFKKATSAGGLFFNSTINQSKTTAGLLSTVQGNVEELAKALFEGQSGGINAFANGLVKLTSNTDAFVKAIDFALHSGALGFLLDLFQRLGREAEEAAKSQEKFTRALLSQQEALLLTNQTAAERAKTIENIILLNSRLGQSFKGTTEDPLPWVKPEKVKVLFDLDKALAAFEARFARMDSIRRKAFEAPLKVGDVDTSPFVPSKTTEESLQASFDRMVEMYKNFKGQTQGITQGIKQDFIDLGPAISGSIAQLADAFGQAVVGARNFGQAVLNTLFEFIKQFGAAMIAVGVGKVAFDTFSGPAMIAAGAALVALAGAAQATMKNRPNLSAASVGSNFSTFNRGSVSGNSQNQEITLRAKGSDLIGVLKLAGQDNGSRRS